MITAIATFIYCIITLFKPDQAIYIENLLLKKENEILRRKLKLQRINISRHDKLLFVMLNLIGSIKNKISIVTPKTLLHWQRRLIASFWTFMKHDTHAGRPPVPAEVKKIILTMKNDNLFWGAKRIRDELLKLGVDLHRKTIQNILKEFRRRGKIRKTYTWKKFLRSHAESLFAMDFFTVDTIFNQRYYVFFIICHKTREIVQCALSPFPNGQFVKQQMIDFRERVKGSVHLIRDRTGQFFLD